ncbi:small integral membrane protein 28-like [Oncorhynchus mykiss]|uniref:small integral membrane protein 28-like n=1 Tax=Oncorhynchus mykiss TaxID=8022 RepID=UPI001877F064|nr:small integral membrane protein 28-like [Oncorhynchus mykiss]
MRTLLDSSWIKFGPAGRGSIDWVTGSPSPPMVERQLQGDNWNELNLEQEGRSGLLLYVVLPVASLLMLGLLVLLAYWRCSPPKLSLDLQDPESSAEFLSSLTGHGERRTSTSSDMSDSMFVMVYLPPPYEETLTKITRATSLTSRKESMNIEDLEARLCPEIKSSGRYV